MATIDRIKAREALATESRQWWYHQQLRRQGTLAEAERLETRDTENGMARLEACARNGGFVMVGPHGWSMFYSHNSMLSGYGTVATCGTLQAALAYGIPVIDTSTCGAGARWGLASTEPTPCIGDDDEPGSRFEGTLLAKVNWRKRLDVYRAAGATLHNCD